MVDSRIFVWMQSLELLLPYVHHSGEWCEDSTNVTTLLSVDSAAAVWVETTLSLVLRAWNSTMVH